MTAHNNLEPHEIQYIKDNAEKLTTAQLSNVIGCSMGTVYAHCKKLKVQPSKSYFQFRLPVIPPLEKDKGAGDVSETKPYNGTRYGNKSREELIDEILNAEI